MPFGISFTNKLDLGALEEGYWERNVWPKLARQLEREANVVIRTAKWPERTGRSRRGFQVTKSVRPRQITVVIRNEVPYAVIIEGKRHLIRNSLRRREDAIVNELRSIIDRELNGTA